MHLIDGRPRLSATDLTTHLACAHATTLDLQALTGEREDPAAPCFLGDLEINGGHRSGRLPQDVDPHVTDRSALVLAVVLAPEPRHRASVARQRSRGTSIH